MQGRLNLLTVGGGDKVQIQNTAEHLKAFGVDVDIIDNFVKPEDYKKYDLVHIFQLDWTPETYLYALAARKAGKKIILSPIHHNVSEVKRFDDEYVFGFRRISKFIFRDQFARDTFKNVYRSVFHPEKILPTLVTAVLGFKNTQRKVLQMSSKVLVQTILEAHDLMATFGVTIDWVKVPNGVGDKFLDPTGFKNMMDFSNYIVCVGRIEPRKNQLSIIEAVKKLRTYMPDLKLVMLGTASGPHKEYHQKFKKEVEAHSWITHIERLPYEKMPSLYRFAKVGVSASWFETTGLTSLEALICGANAVATGDRAKEYLGDYAVYCDPGDISSIANAIEKAYIQPRPKLDPNFVKDYTWEVAAQETYKVYEELLND